MNDRHGRKRPLLAAVTRARAVRANVRRLAQLVPEARARAVMIRAHARRLNELAGELYECNHELNDCGHPEIAAELEEIAGAIFQYADINAEVWRELTAPPPMSWPHDEHRR